MLLTRHLVEGKECWALDGQRIRASLSELLDMSADQILQVERLRETVHTRPLRPCENDHEVWACGVTYLRSRQERESESTVADVYARVYEAERPEIFFKAIGSRVVDPDSPVRIRKDSSWNVPEPEMTLVVNRFGEIVGFTAGNDVSSRSIEGENPLYLPQAKCYDGSCALGPGIVLRSKIDSMPISLTIERNGALVFQGDTNTHKMRRNPEELVSFLFREMSFPRGVLLMTGTGIVPDSKFSLEHGDVISIGVDALTLTNPVE